MGQTPRWHNVSSYKISHNDISLFVSDYGATFQSLFTTDSDGRRRDIILGYDTLKNTIMTSRILVALWDVLPTELPEHA